VFPAVAQLEIRASLAFQGRKSSKEQVLAEEWRDFSKNLPRLNILIVAFVFFLVLVVSIVFIAAEVVVVVVIGIVVRVVREIVVSHKRSDWQHGHAVGAAGGGPAAGFGFSRVVGGGYVVQKCRPQRGQTQN
jgi:hypothetical protein